MAKNSIIINSHCQYHIIYKNVNLCIDAEMKDESPRMMLVETYVDQQLAYVAPYLSFLHKTPTAAATKNQKSHPSIKPTCCNQLDHRRRQPTGS